MSEVQAVYGQVFSFEHWRYYLKNMKMATCESCFVRNTRMPTAHKGDCLAKRDVRNIKWFRFGKLACCLICLKLCRSSSILALHTLTHNLFEIKFLGLHPLLLFQVA